ncbi:MAG: hypothetical protein GY708_13390 [Actinomycetia bacterium]|nr:hypothetical protein [Actinomycetes bacterium]MCP4963095.1 hypothetical protein [Actinomycetes bacterium]
MFNRFKREFPADPRLAATNETAQAWDRIIGVDRAIAVFRGSARAAAKIATRLAALETRQPVERDRQVSSHEWSGSAELVVGHTSPGLRAGQPFHRRVLRSDYVTGFPAGWLRVSPVELLWQPTPRRDGSPSSTSIDVARMPASDIVDIELVSLGRHGAGMTVTGASDDQLWLYLPDRRKVDDMALRLRYGDRS